MDFYAKKTYLRNKIKTYLIRVSENPDDFKATEWEAICSEVLDQTGFSEKAIVKELDSLGIRYNKNTMLFERVTMVPLGKPTTTEKQF